MEMHAPARLAKWRRRRPLQPKAAAGAGQSGVSIRLGAVRQLRHCELAKPKRHSFAWTKSELRALEPVASLKIAPPAFIYEGLIGLSSFLAPLHHPLLPIRIHYHLDTTCNPNRHVFLRRYRRRERAAQVAAAAAGPGLPRGPQRVVLGPNPNAPDVNSGKVNVVPSDSDLEHLKTQSQEAYDEAVAKAREQRKQLEQDAQKASNAAKKTANDAHKAGKDAAEDAKKAGKDAADDAKKAGKELADDAKKTGKQVADDAEKLGKEARAEADKFGKNARAEAEKAGKKAGELYEKGKKELSKDTEALRKRGEEGAKKLKKKAGEAEKELESWWNQFSRDPKQWVPALAAANVALLGGLGIYAYSNRDNVQRTDRRLISAATVGILGLLGAQGYWANETAKKQNGSL